MLCFRKLLVGKKIMDKREGEYQDFPSKIFCLTVPKNFVGEPFRVSLISGIEKFYAQEGYVTTFRCLAVPKKFRTRTVLGCDSENFRGRKSLDKREGGGGSIKIYRPKFLCLTVPKISVAEPFSAVFQKIPGSEKVYG